MPRGNTMVTKVHYKGNNDDFVVFADSPEVVKQWRGDRSIPLAQVVSSFTVYVTHKQGNQGMKDTASKGTLESEFGTSRDDDVITIILERGEVMESENPGRGGDRNITMGPQVSHGPQG